MRTHLKKAIAVAIVSAMLPLSAAAAPVQNTASANSILNLLGSSCKTIVYSVQGTCKNIQQYVESVFGGKPDLSKVTSGKVASTAGGTTVISSSSSTCSKSASSAASSKPSAPSSSASSKSTSSKSTSSKSTSSKSTSSKSTSSKSTSSKSTSSKSASSSTSSKSAPSKSTSSKTTASSGSASSKAASSSASSAGTTVSGLSAEENAVVTLVNQQRAANGLAALTVNSKLSNMARVKSQDMVTNHYFAHESPTYGSPFDMMKTFGIQFTAAGENIAYGQTDAQSVMNAWMNSSGHRANILNSSYTQIGVGAVKDSSGTIYWTQEFIRP